jgi:phage gpG-like protein
MAERIGMIGKSALMDRILASWSISAQSMLRKQFDTGTDPYGNKWKPLKRDYKPRIGGPLYKTGALRNSFEIIVDESGLFIRSDADYSGFHQSGTVNMVRRQMVPSISRGLPAAWRKSFKESAAKLMKASMVKR